MNCEKYFAKINLIFLKPTLSLNRLYIRRRDEMNDDILKKLIKNTIDNLPIPWEQLWMVFQRIMQCMPQSVPALEGENQGKIEKKSDKEKHVTNQSKQERGRN